MRISHISVNNFRSIKELDCELPQVCALVGPNNAGKSNILSAIRRVIGRDWLSVTSFSEEDVFGRDESQDVRIAVTFDPPIDYKKFKYSDAVPIPTLSFEYTRYEIGEFAGKRRLEQQCLNAKGKPVSVLAKAPKKGVPPQFEHLTGIPGEVREQIPLIYLGTHRPLSDHLPDGRYSLLRPLFEDIDRDLHSESQIVSVTKSDGSVEEVQRAELFERLMSKAMKLLHTESFESLENSIKRNALRLLGFNPDTDTDKLDFYFAPFSTMDFYKALGLRVKEGGYSISATELGEGSQNAIVLAVLQAFEQRRKQGAILLIEEPEMFLHPQMQRSLYKTILNLAATNQVIYTTHSPHFVTIPDFEQVRIVRKGTLGTKVHASALPRDDKFSEKLRKEFDPERNELFFANRLLLVEGDTEKLSFPEYAKRLMLDLDYAGASIVEVGGKRNLVDFARIALSFGIPTGIVFDEDSTDIKDPEENATLNKQLLAFEDVKAQTKVWCLKKKFEDELKTALGAEDFQKACQKYPGPSKVVRSRLISQDAAFKIPTTFETILTWLANRDSKRV